MSTLALLLVAAAISHALARGLRLSALPMLILSGFVLARLGLLPDDEIVSNILVLGASFLLFVAGTELNPRRIGRHRMAAMHIGLVQFAVLGLGGFVIAIGFGYGVVPSLFVALAMAASSTLVVVRILQQRQQMFEPFGRTVLGVLLLQDVLVILLIPLVSRMTAGMDAMLAGFGATVILVGLTIVCVQWLAPRFVLHMQADEESLLLGILALLFVFIALAAVFGLPLMVGAFLAGVALSAFPTSGLVHGQLKSISDFFTAIFFTALGAIVVIPSPDVLLQTLVFAALIIVLTPVLVTLIGEAAGLSARPALESGLILAQTSEFSILIGLQALVLGTLAPEIFTVIVLVTVITMILTPFLATDAVTWRLMRFHPLRLGTEYGRGEPPADHVLMLGCSENAMPLLETLILAGYQVFVVDEDPSIIETLIRNEVPCLRGDVSDGEVLERAGIERARIVISMARQMQDNRAALRHAARIPVIVRVFESAEAEQIRQGGGIPVSNAEAAADSFLEWFQGRFGQRLTPPKS
jgi:Kef-type K+ transport system membrane component KefB